jgi:glycosyltransferase involved in cell wall biosynthesis
MNLHIVRNGVLHDSRVLKETQTLSDSDLVNEVEIAGFSQPGLPERQDLDHRRVWRVSLKSRSLPKNLLSQSLKYAEWRYRVVDAYRRSPLKVIHCHDLEPLPIGVRLKQLTGAKLVYDAHELETERAYYGKLRKRIMQRMEQRCMKHVDSMITVSPSIQEWYRDRFPDVPVGLVRNVPKRREPGFKSTALKSKLGISPSSLLFIYQGAQDKGRGIEVTLDAFASPEVDHHVVFMGDGALADKVRSAASQHANIHWLEPVPPEIVLSMTAGADIGLSLIEDISLSYRFCLPNKLFEYWLAGIPVMVSNLPDQASLVRQYNAGWVVSLTLPKYVAKLREVSVNDIEAVRPGLEQVEREFSWEHEAEQLLAVYGQILGQEYVAI